MKRMMMVLIAVSGSAAIGYVSFGWLIPLALVNSQSPPAVIARPKVPPTPVSYELTGDSAGDFAAFPDFALYWLGDTYQGLPLTKIIRNVSPANALFPQNSVIFLYGTCTTEDPSGECSYPLEMHEQPFCTLLPEMVAGAAKESGTFQIRGADAQAISGGIVLWTSDVSITVYNDTLDSSKEAAAAQDLTPLNRLSTGATLPAVNPDCSNYEYGPPRLTGITATPEFPSPQPVQ